MTSSTFNKPDFIIIGAMKCATSTLHDQLAAQKGFKMSEPKEPNFFSNDEIYSKGLDWYSSLFESETAILRGESSTHYTKLPTYPKTISRLLDYGLGDAKLIYVVRHPIDRLVSHFIHEWSEANISCEINEAIERCPDLIDYSNYHTQLSAFLEHYPKEKVCVVFFEHFVKHTQIDLEKVCEFLSYPHKPVLDNSQDAKNVSSQRVRKFPLYKLIIDSKAMTFLRRSLIPKSFREKIRNSLTMKDRPQLSSENKELLARQFDTELKELGALLGLDLSIDNYREVAKQQAALTLIN